MSESSDNDEYKYGTVLSHLSGSPTYPNFGVKKVSFPLKCENYHLPASVCVKKDLKKLSVKWVFFVFNKIFVVFVEVYFSKQYERFRIAKNHVFQALQMFQNVIEWSKSHLNNELLPLQWISRHHHLATTTYVRVPLRCVVSIARIFGEIPTYVNSHLISARVL